MSSIIFRINGPIRQLGLGDSLYLTQVAYFRGKQLGYEDITLEWPHIVTGPKSEYVECPKDTIFPIKYITRKEFSPDDYSKIINLREHDSLFPGFSGIDKNPIFIINGIPFLHIAKNFIGIYAFSNWYHETTNNRPVFNLPKDKLKKPYILFHHRHYKNHPRDTNSEIHKPIIDYIKYKTGNKYEMWKIGEPSNDDDIYDKIIENKNSNIAEFYKLENNASYQVGGAQTGPSSFSVLFGIPNILLDADCKVIYYPKEWRMRGGWGNTAVDWWDKDKHLILYVNDCNINKIKEHIDKWL